MKILTRYLARETLTATLFTLVVLIVFFALFDLMQELDDIGRGQYRLGTALAFVALTAPAHVYEVFPIAALIGTLTALAGLASHSELTVMRASGLSLRAVARGVFFVGLLLVFAMFAVGEFITPFAERTAQSLRLNAMEQVVAQQFRSGLWVKDERSFVNVREVRPGGRSAGLTLVGVKIYEFDEQHRLKSISVAETGRYVGNHRWRIEQVMQTFFQGETAALNRLPEAVWRSVLTPEVLSVLLLVPEQMSVTDLWTYAEHLRENKQNATRYEMALWSKATTPLSLLLMMWLAVPFASTQRRSEKIGPKVFIGVMLGLAFYLLNRMVFTVGLLNDWPPFLTAMLPVCVVLTFTIVMFKRVERV